MAPMSRSIVATACAITLLIGLAGCSSDSSGSDGATATTAAGSDVGTDPASGTDASSDPGSSAEGDCVTDSNELSGSSTVIWDDGDIAPNLVMTFVDNENKLDPPSLTVKVGERFGVAHGPGTDLRSVKVGCAGGQTMPLGVTAGFVITSPGTFTIIDEAADDYAGAEVGSVTVE